MADAHIPTPNKDNMRRLISASDDESTSQLVLTKAGDFELVKFPHGNSDEYAVVHAAWVAGNNYTGPGAAEDSLHVDDAYAAMMDGWQRWLNDGVPAAQRKRVFVGEP